MSISVPLPTPFMPCPGEPAIPFPTWLKMFDNYMLVIAASGDSWPDARKRAVLLHALGTEGQRLFYTLPNTGDTFTTAIAALKEHFVPKVNVIAERHKFRQRAQRPDETVNQFLASLWELAATCDFGNMEDQMLRDQLIEGVAYTRVRDRLLLEPDLTLAKATTLALQIESGLRDANVLSDATAASASAPVRAVQKQPKQSRRLDTKKKPPDPAPATTQAAANRRSCFRCGSFNHIANKPSCPAANMTCNKCGKVGHFSRVCRSTQKECTSGFINDGNQLKVTCPSCRKSFCAQCKKPWEPQHQDVSCEQFQLWKRENDPEYQRQGLAGYLRDNGITCPECKFQYALTKGGCMHFTCSQCRHQFCSGCNNPYYKMECKIPQCKFTGLHAHHPRDCLFYLRDWDADRLQALLQRSRVAFNTDPSNETPTDACGVMEQKDEGGQPADSPCGLQTQPGQAGLCMKHYREYLVSLINDHSLDPAVLYETQELVVACQRYLGDLKKGDGEDDNAFSARLLKKLMEVPLGEKVPRSK